MLVIRKLRFYAWIQDYPYRLVLGDKPGVRLWNFREKAYGLTLVFPNEKSLAFGFDFNVREW